MESILTNFIMFGAISGGFAWFLIFFYDFIPAYKIFRGKRK